MWHCVLLMLSLSLPLPLYIWPTLTAWNKAFCAASLHNSAFHFMPLWPSEMPCLCRFLFVVSSSVSGTVLRSASHYHCVFRVVVSLQFIIYFKSVPWPPELLLLALTGAMFSILFPSSTLQHLCGTVPSYAIEPVPAPLIYVSDRIWHYTFKGDPLSRLFLVFFSSLSLLGGRWCLLCYQPSLRFCVALRCYACDDNWHSLTMCFSI